MGKKQKRNRREEERRIIAEMQAAVFEENANTGGLSEIESAENSAEKQPTKAQIKREKKNHGYDETMPEKLHCPRCKTLMEKGVCPSCGYRVYVPMDKKKRDRVRMIVAIVCIVGFLIIYLATQFAGK